MKRINLIVLTISFICGLYFVSCKSTDLSQAFSSDSEKTPVVQTLNGKVRGVVNSEGSVDLFAGIPFAKPPVGNLRWRIPEDVENWDGILETDHFAPMSMQKQSGKAMTKLWNKMIHSDGDRTDRAEISEDCLYLNIWRPASASKNEKLPVLVYVHGGSLTSGSSWFENYDGETMAKQNIIFVTIAYRTGIFGFFGNEELLAESGNKTTGNYGLLDQIKALEWINKNIAYFGGDVSNITIAGESAGSSSVNALCCSPLTEGYFRRAIGESSSLVVQVPSHTFRSQKDTFTVGNKIMNEFNCKSVEELRKIPAEKLLTSKYRNNCMTVDNYAMPEYPWELYEKGLNHEEALLNGFNMKEGFAFTFFTKINLKNYKDLLRESPYIPDVDALCSIREVKTDQEAKEFYNDVFSAICFNFPHDNWSRKIAEQGKPVYKYCFTKENGSISTAHSGEIPYAYGNLHYNTKAGVYDESDYELEKRMVTFWANFAKYGNPNGNFMPFQDSEHQIWKTFNATERLLDLGTELKMTEDPFEPIYKHLNFNIDKQKRPPTFGDKE